jgi:uncharacterized protein (TIGR02001 family)
VLAPPSLSRLARFVAPALYSAAACGQVGGSIVAESDYRYRGVSLNGEDPSLHVSLAYDHLSGWYAGASLTGVELEPGPKRIATTAYAGFASRKAAGWTWEAGATLNHFSGNDDRDYAEAYAGVLAEGWNARLYFAPRYFGGSVRTLYAEVNAGRPLTPVWRAFAHVGALARVAGDAPIGSDRVRYDARLGLGLRLSDWDAQLAWVTSSSGGIYPAAYEQRRSTVVLSVGYDF